MAVGDANQWNGTLGLNNSVCRIVSNGSNADDLLAAPHREHHRLD